MAKQNGSCKNHQQKVRSCEDPFSAQTGMKIGEQKIGAQGLE
jgi:hypothetical protein